MFNYILAIYMLQLRFSYYTKLLLPQVTIFSCAFSKLTRAWRNEHIPSRYVYLYLPRCLVSSGSLSHRRRSANATAARHVDLKTDTFPRRLCWREINRGFIGKSAMHENLQLRPQSRLQRNFAYLLVSSFFLFLSPSQFLFSSVCTTRRREYAKLDSRGALYIILSSESAPAESLLSPKQI